MCGIPENVVTTDLVIHPRCNKPIFERIRNFENITLIKARFMYVFENGDLHTAAHFLADRMHEPFEVSCIGGVAVQNSVAEEFTERVRSRFRQLKPHVATHPHFERSVMELKRCKVNYLTAPIENAPPIASPILVTDRLTHLFFSKNPSGVVILNTFDTIQEAAEAFNHEQPRYDSIIVFDESISSVYALAEKVKCVQFYVNCFDVCMMPILSYYGMRKSAVLLEGGYHYENLELAKIFRMIVFPFSTTFLRRCCCPPNQCTCKTKFHICCD